MSLCMLLLTGVVSTVSAYVSVSGTGYQTVTHQDIPGGGQIHYDTYYGSKKATTGNFATIINSSKTAKSELVGIRTTASLAQEYGCSKGTVYFSAVTSHSIEPSNSCDVTMKFSADDLK